ncbi:DUF5954 family protein [Streptomyces sp. NPDC050416]|uniref:DUF5954 family protein n=1 Tax=Streptomyces sp. NPDC050416 TaxID=3365611 RepID=UPI0037BB6A51
MRWGRAVARGGGGQWGDDHDTLAAASGRVTGRGACGRRQGDSGGPGPQQYGRHQRHGPNAHAHAVILSEPPSPGGVPPEGGTSGTRVGRGPPSCVPDTAFVGSFGYRVVRGDEFARCNDDGLEPPRPTDPEPARQSWTGRPRTPRPRTSASCSTRSARTSWRRALRLGRASSRTRVPDSPPTSARTPRKAVATHPDPVLRPPVSAWSSAAATAGSPAARSWPRRTTPALQRHVRAVGHAVPVRRRRDGPVRARRRGVQGTRPRRRVRLDDRVFRTAEFSDVARAM